MILSLQSLRFIFAVMIFLHHYAVNGKSIFEAGGTCGVSFFMILSGFVLSVGNYTKIQQHALKYDVFFYKRIIRIYPLHVLCFVGFVVLNLLALTQLEYFKLIPNFLLLQSWIPEKSYYFSGNAVSWYLSDLLFFYAVFPFLIMEITNCTRKKISIIAISILLIYCSVLYFLPEKWVIPCFYISPLFRLLDFIFGIFLYYLYCKIMKSKWSEKLKMLSFVQKSILECIPILFLVLILITFPYVTLRLSCASYYWIPMALLILVFAVLDKQGGIFSLFLSKKVLLRLGEISFSFYMIHQLGIRILSVCINRLHIDIIWEIKVFAIFVIVLIGSFFVYRYYEKPMTYFLKTKLK